mmetsp:Transcript_44187/g.103343  ORF Transcript_44187/g.103343 Transcript_44187/m.103343 type:complete len:233 (+) Transcript_44187:328-1026(+)
MPPCARCPPCNCSSIACNSPSCPTAPPPERPKFAASHASTSDCTDGETTPSAPAPASAASGLLGASLYVTPSTSAPALTCPRRTSSTVASSSTILRSSASGPIHVSPVAISSMLTCGRFCSTQRLKSVNTPSMSSLVLFRSASSSFFVGVSVRLYLPAVTVEKATPSFFSRSYTLGISVITPIEPSTANGAAIILSAVQAIKYPPDAATCSTQIVSRSPACLSRCNCAPARP